MFYTVENTQNRKSDKGVDASLMKGTSLYTMGVKYLTPVVTTVVILFIFCLFHKKKLNNYKNFSFLVVYIESLGMSPEHVSVGKIRHEEKTDLQLI